MSNFHRGDPVYVFRPNRNSGLLIIRAFVTRTDVFFPTHCWVSLTPPDPKLSDYRGERVPVYRSFMECWTSARVELGKKRASAEQQLARFDRLIQRLESEQ